MRISLKATNLDLTPSIKTFIDTKVGALDKYLKRFEAEGELELRVEIARTTRHHRHGEVFMAELNLQVPGKLLRAVKEDEDVRTAIDGAREILKLEIEKYKTQKDPRTKRVTK